MVHSDDEIAAAALAGLPGIGRARLRDLWAKWSRPCLALEALLAGRVESTHWARWRTLDAWPAHTRPERVAENLERFATHVLLPHDRDWPIPSDCLDPPALLFARGECFEALHRPTVAIVGTRSASPHGLADSREFAGAAAHAGRTVVSGLAVGIDAAAHNGALDVGGLTIGVVATGPDVVYPRNHDSLHARIREGGLVLGEQPFGVQPNRGLFPERNRIIAALAPVCVVIEATARGGALSTAAHARRMQRTLMVVPGSRRNPACAGSNALLRDGATPLLDRSDLFVALELADAGTRTIDDPTATSGPAIALPPDAEAVRAALAGEPATLDQIVSRTQLAPARVSGGTRDLERFGLVTRRSGKIWPT